MIRNQFLSAALSAMGLLLVAPAVMASPVVRINDGQTNACIVTPPPSGTVFTLSTQGDVLITGTYSGAGCGTGSGGTNGPTFAPFTPAAADLTIPNNSLASTGGSVNPAFVAYYSTSCTGSVSASASCTNVTGAWAGGAVCTGTINTAGQTYCSPSAAVSIPSNSSTTAACTYTFQANCSNGSTSKPSQTATVTVAKAGSGGGGGGCVDGSSSGDLSTFGYTRQCSGALTDQNKTLSPHWTSNTISDLLSAAWPGAPAQLSYALMITINKNQYASFSFNTGSSTSGLSFTPNISFGMTGNLSISDVPGDYYSGTAHCSGSTISVSSKSGTTASCVLQPNTNYYLNISANDAIDPQHASDCANASCVIAVAPYPVNN